MSKNSGFALLLCLASALIILRLPARCAAGSRPRPVSEDDICDPLADYYLGMEDYPEAIRRHLIVIQQHPGRALAYYHLGFAYGVMGNHQRELAEYQKAVQLGLSDWQLFLNLGLLYIETNRLEDAKAVLRLAVLLGPYRPETHFNLGLAYERLGVFPMAEQEILLSLRLDPDQVDARNTLGVIYAEEGNYQRAREEWSDLASSNPDFTPARANLAILSQVESGRLERAKHLSAFAHAP